MKSTKLFNFIYLGQHCSQPINEEIRGVYALILDDYKIYIGSSTNVYARVLQHKRKGKNIKEVHLLEDLTKEEYPFNKRGWLMVRECLYWAEFHKNKLELENKAPFLFLTNVNTNYKLKKHI